LESHSGSFFLWYECGKCKILKISDIWNKSCIGAV